MLEKMKSFKKIDAHSHVGYFGSWSDVGITPEELVAQMDEYNVEKTVISTFPIAELARELDIPLMIHTGHPPFSLPWSVAQLADIYPDVTMVMIHMGHGNGMYVQPAIDMAKKYPNLYLETSGMPMHTKIKEAYETVGADRIMWGLDAPFHHPTVEMQRTIVSGLTDEQLEDVFYNNAKKLLKL
ncbi:MAG: TatD family hydrolase [Bacillota bacterium]|nr:TatD family hydrolase [Bacillota bacterium]